MTPESAVSVLSFALKAREGRGNWLSTWEELATYFLPNRTGFLGDRPDGEERMEDVYTSTPILARRGLATTMSTMLRPAGIEWFKAKAKNKLLQYDENVRLWLDAATQITYDLIYDPAVKAEAHLSECDSDLVTFGTAVLQVRWDKALRRLKLKTIPLRNAVLAQGESGEVDMAFIFTTLKLRQILQMFGEDKLPPRMTDALRQDKPDLDKEFELLHACLPNEDYKRFGRGPNRLPYASLWFSVLDKEMIDQGGYTGFPYIVPRWDTASGEVYGRGPAHVALNDARLANVITRTMVQAGEKALDPPLVAPADMIRGDVELFAGGLTLYDSAGFQFQGDPIRPVNLGTQPQKMLEFLSTVENRIYAAFYRDILQLPSAEQSDRRTAAEINARLDQYLREAAPVFGRIEQSYNAAFVNRVFNLAAENGVFPPAPEVLQGQEIEFEYESPVKQARDRARAMKVVESLQIVGGIATMKPEVIDNVDGDVTTRMILMDMGNPQAIMTPVQEMMATRAERAKQAKMMQMAQLAQMAGPAAAPTLTAAAKAKEQGLIPESGDEMTMLPAPDGANPVSSDRDIIEGVFNEVAG